MGGYGSGRRAEYRARGVLESSGYTVVRAAGSKGPVDLVAFNGQHWRLISVKRGVARLSPLEREILELLPVPPQTSVEYWRFPNQCRAPIIEVL